MKDFKIRCSCISEIMTNPRSKSEQVSKTTQTYLETYLKEQIFNRQKNFSNRYTEKGEIVEDEAIEMAIEHLGLIYTMKNEESFENDYLTGTPDLVYPDEVLDIKSSWDCFTFPYFETEIPTKGYYYQLQGYMALTGASKARLVYVLCDTPLHLIEKEALYTLNGRDYEEHLEYLKGEMTYSDIALENRVKSFEIERDEQVINSIYERVELCREILSTYKIPVIA